MSVALPEHVARRPRYRLRRSEALWGPLLALPAILGFLIFTVGPMLGSFVIGMTDWQIGGTPHWVGAQNYKTMLTADPLFYKSLGVTLYYVLGAVPLLLFVAFVAALLLNQKVRGQRIFRTIFYLPVLVPSIANTVLWLWIFNPDYGLLNSALRGVGLPGSQWIFDERTAIPSLILMGAWGFGNATLIFLAGLQDVPVYLYEAVDVDGGTAWHKLRYVTLPIMTPTIFFNLVIGLIAAFQTFNEAFVMTSGGPNNSTLMYVFYLYRTAFSEGRLGYASALSWVLFLVILVVTFLVFRFGRSWVYYEGEKR